MQPYILKIQGISVSPRDMAQIGRSVEVVSELGRTCQQRKTRSCSRLGYCRHIQSSSCFPKLTTYRRKKRVAPVSTCPNPCDILIISSDTQVPQMLSHASSLSV